MLITRMTLYPDMMRTGLHYRKGRGPAENITSIISIGLEGGELAVIPNLAFIWEAAAAAAWAAWEDLEIINI